MAAYKWTAAYFMSEKEIDALPEERKPKLKDPPKSFDLSKAERVVIDKSEMKVNEI